MTKMNDVLKKQEEETKNKEEDRDSGMNIVLNTVAGVLGNHEELMKKILERSKGTSM